MKTTSMLVAALAVVATGAASACESGHWVKSVSRDGGVVVLEDNSVWQIDAYDPLATMLWLPTTDITVCDDKLINTEDGETAEARRLR